MDKTESLKDLMALPWHAQEIAEQLERRGWKYDPPKPVLPMVSDAAIYAYAAVGGFIPESPPSPSRIAGLRAAFKVIAQDPANRDYLRGVLEGSV